MQHYKNSLAGILLFLFIAVGCTPLKEVKKFYAGSERSLSATDLDYGFEQFIRDSCLSWNTTFTDLREIDCDATNGFVADTVMRYQFGTLQQYFFALEMLAGNSKIDFTPVGQSFAAGEYGPISISDKQASASNNISKFITSAVTLHYKQRKLKGSIRKYHEDVSGLLEQLVFELTILQSKIELLRSHRKLDFALAVREGGTVRQRKVIAEIYIRKDNQIKAAIDDCQTKIKMIEKIKEGEQALFDHVADLRTTAFRNKMKGLTMNLIYLNKTNTIDHGN